MELDPHDYLRDLRAFLGRRRGEAILLGEVNLPAAEQRRVLRRRGRRRAAHAVRLPRDAGDVPGAGPRRRRPAARGRSQQRPEIPPEAQWATFLRNHDELTLDKLTDRERDEVFAAFGPEPDMQLYGRGLRRRLPTMLGRRPSDGSGMAYSLMFSLPGTPTLFYGEEIGMAENLAIDDRLGRAHPDAVVRRRHRRVLDGPTRCAVPPAARPSQGSGPPTASTSRRQRTDPSSLLNWFERLIRLRKELPGDRLGPLPRCSTAAHRRRS